MIDEYFNAIALIDMNYKKYQKVGRALPEGPVVFDIEAMCLGTAEQALDGPAPGIWPELDAWTSTADAWPPRMPSVAAVAVEFP